MINYELDTTEHMWALCSSQKPIISISVTAMKYVLAEMQYMLIVVLGRTTIEGNITLYFLYGNIFDNNKNMIIISAKTRFAFPNGNPSSLQGCNKI